MSKKLQTIDAETLLATPLKPVPFIVGGLIPRGLHILAGSPKIGKSWLVLWLCLKVMLSKAGAGNKADCD